MLNWPYKDPDEVLDYLLDWSSRLGNDDKIVSSTWVSSSPELVMNSNTFTDTVATLWLSAGLDKKSYVLKNTVTTFKGRTMEQSVGIKINQK